MAGGTLIAAVAAQAGGSAAATTTAEGVYDKNQAKSGEVLYEQHCLVCHDKNYFRPVLERWNGQSLAVFFDVMAGSMPESNPGGLLDDEYVDILAYLFSRSRFPVGEGRLGLEDLDTLTIEHPEH